MKKKTRKQQKTKRRRVQRGCCHKHHRHTSSCRSRTRSHRGGLRPLPPAFIGKPWIPHAQHGNHYVLNEYVHDIPLQIKPSNSGFNGGTKRQTRKRKRRGGGLISQDLVSLGQQFGYGAQSTYNTLRGIPSTPNPLPFADQFPRHAPLLH